MKILLVHPEFPVTYWGVQRGLQFTRWRSSLPPLGLISLAALLPAEWTLRLVDLNIDKLRDRDLLWADAVFVGGMRIQMPSMQAVLGRAKALGRRTVVGGPAATTSPDEFPLADLVFQGEAEGRIPSLCEALGAPPGEIRRLAPDPHAPRPNLAEVPIPRFDLLDLKAYASMSVQFSRGCPFQCEFCDIIEIFGRVPRVKPVDRLLAELDTLYGLGWRGSVFVVDDNFIGHKPAARQLLAALATWQTERGWPYELYTEASVNLATDAGLVSGLVQAGFTSVFLGIETPSLEALKETGKVQNLKFDLSEAVLTLNRAGLEVMAGFIVGFDSDGPEVFEAQRQFIAGLPLPLAMVGLLMALPSTALWRRLEREGRLRTLAGGDQLERPNFTPVMDEVTLLRGYRDLLASLYSPEAYYARCEAYVRMAPRLPGRKRVTLHHLRVLASLMVGVGLGVSHRAIFWRLSWLAATKAPHNLSWLMGHVVIGEHMIRYTQEVVLPRIDAELAALGAIGTPPGCRPTDPPEAAQRVDRLPSPDPGALTAPQACG